MLKIKHLGRALKFEASMKAARDPEAVRAREEAAARARRQRLAESFDRAVQTPEEATISAREMAASLERRGVLLKAPPKDAS